MKKALLVGGRGQKNVRFRAKLEALGIDVIKTWSADQVRGGSVPIVDAVLVLSDVVAHRHVISVQKQARRMGIPVVCISKGMVRTRGILERHGLLDEAKVEDEKVSNKGKKYRKWSDDELDLMGRLRAAGKSWREIAEKLDGDVNKDTIRGVYNSRRLNRSVDKFAERVVEEGGGGSKRASKKDPKRDDADWINLLETENGRLSAEVEGATSVRNDLIDRLKKLEEGQSELMNLLAEARKRNIDFDERLQLAALEKREAFLSGVKVADRLVSGGMMDELRELVSMLRDTSENDESGSGGS